MTLRDLSLSRHARRFKFYVASAKACVKIFAYFVKRFFNRYFLLRLFVTISLFSPREQSFWSFWSFLIYGVITDVSYISIFYSFLPPLVCYAFQSIATFTRVLSFILVFTTYVVWLSSLEIKKIFNK